MGVPPIVSCHVLAMPYPGQGHINPMLNFCNSLLTNIPNVHVTFVVTEEWLGLIGSSQAKPPNNPNFRFTAVPNVVPAKPDQADLQSFLQAVDTKMVAPFEQLLDRLHTPPTLIIYDTLLAWVVPLGIQRNIPMASIWVMSASYFSLFKHYDLFQQHGDHFVNELEEGNKRVDYIPGISSTRLVDFGIDGSQTRYMAVMQWMLNLLSSVSKVQYLLCCTSYELEPQPIHVLKSSLSLPIYHIGPSIPYNSNLSSSEETAYFQWLNEQPSSSVLYFSLGSFFSVSQTQIEEIAAGLHLSGVRFLWVARGETESLREICSGDKGLVIEWCDQLRVLQHKAIGGFWSHCGWNSIKEGVFAGVPFLTFPVMWDQLLNSKIIVEDWKVGLRVKKEDYVINPQSLISREEIAELVKKFMDLNDEEGRDMRMRAKELKGKCELSIAKNGSSQTDINAFIRDITIKGDM